MHFIAAHEVAMAYRNAKRNIYSQSNKSIEELNKNPAEPEQEGRVQNRYFVLCYCKWEWHSARNLIKAFIKSSILFKKVSVKNGTQL